MQGDMRAAKLYLEFVSGVKSISANNPTIQQQNNFTQINRMVLCQDQNIRGNNKTDYHSKSRP